MIDLSSLVSQFSDTVALMKTNLPIVIEIICLLSLIHIVNFFVKYRLNILGIYPRSLFGLFGIVFSPFLHGNFGHLFANALPLFILINFVMLFGLDNFFDVSITIILIGGLGTWLFGRKGLHIGASSVAMGYWAYLLMYSYYQQATLLSVVLAIICLYYLGGLIVNIFPTETKSSWEGHLFGLIAGGIAAYYNSYLPYWIAKITVHF